MNTRATAIPTRLTALVATLAMMAALVVVSAVPAFAATSGYARLAAGANVLPGDFTYSVEVENSGLGSDDANLVVVTMPVGIGVTIADGANLTGPNGFTGKVQSVGTIQRVIYSGGTLAVGDEMRLEIPTTIAAPSSPSETSGFFDVQLSSDSGRTFETAEEGQSDGGGTLTTVIRFLEIELVDTVAPTPLGARDGSGTEGQSIDVAATVRNYLPVPVSIDLELTAASGDSKNYPVNEEISPAQSISVPGNSTATRAFDVTLGAAERNNGNAADRPVNFNAKATEVTFGGTSLATDNLSYEVQIQSRLALAGATFAPRAVAPGPRTFTVDASHSGTPSFTIDGGSINFADTTAQFDGNSATAFASGDSKALSFTGQVLGDDGDFPVEFLYQATDANGYQYTISYGRIKEPAGGLFGGSTDVLVTIDALAPILDLDIDLPSDAEGQQQTEAKDGDSITVTGTIDDSSATLGDVDLIAGGIVIASATPSRSTFDSGSFSATFDDVDFPFAAGSFTARASAEDAAGNVGEAVAEAEEYDNIVPLLLSARTESTSDAPTAAIDALVLDAARISVRFSENNTIIGGCNPNEWSVDGANTVKEVRFSDNTRCTAGTVGPDNERILVLSTAYDRDATPSITYSPSSAAGSVKDGAGNFALENTVTAVTGIVPAVPDLVDVFRNTGSAMSNDQCLEEDGPCETAYFDEDAYWTRFSGDDTVVCVAGGRAGYSVEVTDGNGNALLGTREGVTGSPHCINVPLNSADGTYARGIRFANSAGVGPEVLFNIALDTVKPTIDTVARAGDEVTVRFDDKVVEGEDFALDWLIYERLSSNDLVFYSPDSVTAPGTGDDIDHTTRILTVDFRGYGDFAGVGYDFQSGDFGGAQYADRAGNLMDNVAGPIPPTAQ